MSCFFTLVWMFSLLMFLHCTAGAAELPAGTRLEIRLKTPIASFSAHAGDPIEAVLIAPAVYQGRAVLPPGATLNGTVAHVHRLGLGLVHERAGLDVRFDSLVLADGTRLPVETRLDILENARESVDARGHVTGIRATNSISHRTAAFATRIAMWHPMIGLPFLAGESVLLRFPEPEIMLPAGTELQVVLTGGVRLPASAAPETFFVRSVLDRGIANVVASLPPRAAAQSTGSPADPVNLILIGSRGELQSAFQRSGWTGADSERFSTRIGVFRAIAENRGMRQAPMSRLTLDGRQPDMEWQKSLSTFSKRHHLRIWWMPALLDGRELWASAATQDVGIGVAKGARRLTHQVDPEIDDERAKVVNDLAFAGCVESVTFERNPGLSDELRNGNGEELHTDGRLAVVALKPCTGEPWTPAGEVKLRVTGNWLYRLARRPVLVARSSFLRGNVFYRGWQGYCFMRDWRKSNNDAAPHAPRRVIVQPLLPSQPARPKLQPIEWTGDDHRRGDG